ncbi:hypothetical protein B0H10DRAFT_517457 [Mycena sp. CBHHK59/15]|nr:hypothetical protein B0H10DRAFT_517457 [Mycena sp. CBHHK59/15]
MNPNVVGAIELGTLVAVILLGMVTVQVYVYYINFPHDSSVIKALIAVVWITETAHVVGICYGLYRVTIGMYGQLELPLPLELCTAAILGNVIHPLVQAIFTARIYQLGRHRLLPAVCWAISGFVLGATVILSIKMFSATSIEQYEDQWNWLILALFGSTAGVDLLIAASMCYYTLRQRAQLKQESKNKLDTWISWTAQTGVFTSLAAIAVAVSFATMKHNHLWLAILVLSTCLYSNSLLSLLNGRLNLGYQVDVPFTLSLSTMNRGGRSHVSFSYPPAVHLKPPSTLADREVNSKPSSVRTSDVTRSPHYTLARERMADFPEP